MKRRSKQKLKGRKNPKVDELPLTKEEINNLITDLIEAVKRGSPYFLAKALSLISTGNECKDCDKWYDKCECEKCPDCKFNRCLCDLHLDPFNYFNKVRIIAWNLTKELFDEKILKEIKERILYWLPITVSKQEMSFIKNLLNS